MILLIWTVEKQKKIQSSKIYKILKLTKVQTMFPLGFTIDQLKISISFYLLPYSCIVKQI